MIAWLSIIAGLTLLAIGARALPTPPASPEEVKATSASLALFFGGAYVICGIFCIKLGKHGRVAVALLSIAGVGVALYELVPPMLRHEALPAPLVHGGLLITSMLIMANAVIAWRRGRGVRGA
ncbi:hypothetical protein OAE58_01540 [Akkermansiaceae bacterium]|nr:hypothetical protein [Akkermansiaceae bacterium]MDB4257913.1 hypothetical protein [bacterium]MDA7863966.1 hypothetical protein [Akkermansiaceae bacterium]MDB0056209.1 hypothetical protein [Akkermansiaceae bacterium]MDB0067895.1 hypothetical protein [Akkermansiaceae bacterium]